MTKYLDFHKTFNQNLFALIIRSKPKCNSIQFKLLLRFRILFTFISIAIEASSNETIMPNEGVFQRDVSKSIHLLIFDAIQQVRLRNKRPDSSAIFKVISKAHATNFALEDVKNRIEGLTNEKKLVHNKTAAGLDSFFVTSFVKHSQKLTQNLFLSHNRHQRHVMFQHKQKIAILTLAAAHLLTYVWML